MNEQGFLGLSLIQQGYQGPTGTECARSIHSTDGVPLGKPLNFSASNRVGGFTKRPLDSILPRDGTGLTLNAQASTPDQTYSRKVFVGGLPPDVCEEGIANTFSIYGPLCVDWPHKKETKSYFPPKGYAFVIFDFESSVHKLLRQCRTENGKQIHLVSSPSIKDKPVQIRAWKLRDADYVVDASLPLNPRRTIFIGGVPRPLKAAELASDFQRMFGGVCYAGVDTDAELKYPKGAGRVAFSNQQSYVAAIATRFVQLHGSSKKVEVKPYVLDDQSCDECHGARCGNQQAPFFCGNVNCLQYFCEPCWNLIHSTHGRECHKPLVKEAADRLKTPPLPLPIHPAPLQHHYPYPIQPPPFYPVPSFLSTLKRN